MAFCTMVTLERHRPFSSFTIEYKHDTFSADLYLGSSSFALLMDRLADEVRLECGS